MRLISSSRMTSADASGPNSVTSSPVAGLIIWKPTTSVGCRSARPWMRANFALLIAARMTPKNVLPTPGHAAQQQVAGVDLPLLVLVVGGRDLRQQDDVGERLRRVVADERLAAFGDDGVVEVDGFREIWMHEPVILLQNWLELRPAEAGHVRRALATTTGSWRPNRLSSTDHRLQGVSDARPDDGLPADDSRRSCGGQRRSSATSSWSTRRPDRTHHAAATYADVIDRARRLAVALADLGVRPGDRVATLGWDERSSTSRRIWRFRRSAPSSTRSTCACTPTTSAYIVNDAEDRVVLLDESLLPLYEKFAAGRGRARHRDRPADAGQPRRADLLDYEVARRRRRSGRATSEPRLDEQDAAAMCYTSGTTGRPKGVLYSHRALVLHSFGQGLRGLPRHRASATRCCRSCRCSTSTRGGCRSRCTMFGADQVFPGPYLDADSVLELLVSRAGDA